MSSVISKTYSCWCGIFGRPEPALCHNNSHPERRKRLHLQPKFCYNRRLFFQAPCKIMFEVNPVYNSIKDLAERTNVLRGYL